MSSKSPFDSKSFKRLHFWITFSSFFYSFSIILLSFFKALSPFFDRSGCFDGLGLRHGAVGGLEGHAGQSASQQLGHGVEQRGAEAAADGQAEGHGGVQSATGDVAHGEAAHHDAEANGQALGHGTQGPKGLGHGTKELRRLGAAGDRHAEHHVAQDEGEDQLAHERLAQMIGWLHAEVHVMAEYAGSLQALLFAGAKRPRRAATIPATTCTTQYIVSFKAVKAVSRPHR